MNRNTIVTMFLVTLISCLYIQAQLLIQPGSGLGPFILGKTFDENNKKLQWKNAVVGRDKTNNGNIHLVYNAEGVTFFYTQQDTNGKAVSRLKTSILDSIEITSPFHKVKGTGLSVGKKYEQCVTCEKLTPSNSFVCDSSSTKAGIKFFCDSLCTIAFIRVVQKGK
jgi:hypothetical protein